MTQSHDALGDALTQNIPAMLSAMEAMEIAQQAYHPSRPETVVEFLADYRADLAKASNDLMPLAFPSHVQTFEHHLKACLKYANFTAENFAEAVADNMSFMRATRTLSKARDALFPLATLLNPIHQFFLEPSLRTSHTIPEHWLSEAAESPLTHIENAYSTRGGASIFLPHEFDQQVPKPLVIALHGGGGHGRDQLWDWLREARSRGFVLIAPTSSGDTWDLYNPEQELPQILALIEHVKSLTAIDPEHILLAGMSDGATLSLQLGLLADNHFTHLAPFSGTLDPNLVSAGHILKAAKKPIYLVHGTADWMFPADVGDMTAHLLSEHHADLCYRAIPGLGHAFARTELPNLLTWFTPKLTLETQ